MKYFSHCTLPHRLVGLSRVFIRAFAVLALCLCGVASAQDAHYKLISPAFAEGQSGDGHSFWPVISADGRFIAFTSQARNLLAFPTSGSGGPIGQGFIQNVLIRDVQNGTTKLVSINRAGTSSGNGTSFSPSISADGRFVTFSSTSSDLVDNDTNGNGVDTFIRDTQTDTTTLVSNNSAGASISGGASTLKNIGTPVSNIVSADPRSLSSQIANTFLEFPLVFKTIGETAQSADGRYVIFSYSYSLFDPVAGEVPKSNVARFDTVTGALALLPDTGSCKDGPALCIVDTFQPSVSADGRFVTFAQTAIGYGPGEQLFLGDFASLTTTTITTQGILFNSFPSVIINSRISANGRSVAFATRNQLLPQDKNFFFDVYRYDRDLDPAGVSGVIQFGQRIFGVQEDGGSVTIPVLRSAFGATGPTTVQFSTADQTAKAGSDYVATSRTLTFNSGEDVKFITVPVLNDNVSEGIEAFTLILSNPTDGYVIGGTNPNASVFIHDSIKPTVTIDDVTTTEGGDAVFTVRLSQAPNGYFAVNFSSADNTATAQGDYNSTPSTPHGGAVFFDVGQKMNTIIVHTNRDLDNEPDETFFVNLSPITDDYIIERAQGVGTIHNDNTPAVEFVVSVGASFFASESSGSAVITVSRTAGDPSIPFSVNYATAEDTASERSDYNAALGRLDFAPGELSKTFTVLLNDDSFVENTEYVTLTLSSPTNGAILGGSTALLLISSDDSAPPSTNPLDDSRFFVTQHYKDFLNRLPDQSGLDFWTNELNTLLGRCDSLPAGEQKRQCVLLARAQISTAFFLSIESQQTGYLVYRLYRESFNRPPTLREFLADTREIGRGVVVGADGWVQKLEASKQKFADDWIKRPDFRAAFDSMSSNAYVSTLFLFGGGDSGAEPGLQQALAGGLNAAPTTETRATVLRKVADSRTVFNKQYNPGLVLMQYFTYLRRNPSDAPDNNLDGYNFWLAKLDASSVSGEDMRNPGTALARIKRAQMVEAFIDSTEYRSRLGP
jgi:hypothetical protein